jgi:hypothetical protein
MKWDIAAYANFSQSAVVALALKLAHVAVRALAYYDVRHALPLTPMSIRDQIAAALQTKPGSYSHESIDIRLHNYIGCIQ